LNKHADKINQKVNFVIDNAPQKLHEEILGSRQILSQLQNQYIQNGVGLNGGLVHSEYTSDWKGKLPASDVLPH
jgi:hypothetical protein